MKWGSPLMKMENRSYAIFVVLETSCFFFGRRVRKSLLICEVISSIK
jgi:hypothetical protein